MSLQPATPNDYTVPVSDNDWAQMLQSNREAQELLSNAIAHHQEHYEDPLSSASATAAANNNNIKRIGHSSHLHHKSDHYNQEPSAEGQFSEGEGSSDDASTPGDGKPAPKKAGRKPLTTEPTTKRKAQNRAAQRAFRERKEKYVKSLEDRIKELEELNPGKGDTKLAEENMNLKVLVQKLETENYFLKEQSFNFDFPISQPGLYNISKAQRDASAQNVAKTLSPTSQQAIKATAAQVDAPKAVTDGKFPTPTTSERQWTPPSSGGDSVPNSPLNHDLPTPDQETMSQVSSSDNAGIVPRFRHSTPEEMALFSTLLDGTGNTYGNAALSSPLNNNTTNNHTGLGDINTLMGLHNTNNNALGGNLHSPMNTHLFGSTTNNNNNLANQRLHSTSPATSLALFSDNSPSPTIDDLVNTPMFHTDKDGVVHFTPPAVPMSASSLSLEQTQALFTDFRDPSDPRDFFAGYEDTVDNTFQDNSLDALLSDPLLDYTHAFANAGIVSPHSLGPNASPMTASTPTITTQPAPAPVVIPSKEDPEESKDGFKHTLPPLVEGEQTIPCPQAWEQLAKHPNFDDVDIDELCAELKSKAKCSGHGPVIPVSEVDKVMNRLNQY